MSELTTAIVVGCTASIVGSTFGVLLNLFLTRGRNAPQSQDNTLRSLGTEDVKEAANKARKSKPKPRKPPRPKPDGSQPPTNDDSGIWGILLGTLVAVIIVVAFYLRHRETIIAIIIGVVAFSLAAALAGLITSAILGVKLRKSVKAQVAINAVLGAAGLVGLYLVSHPPLVPPGTDFDRIIASGSTLSVTNLVTELGSQDVFYIAYQVVGLGLMIIAMAFVLLHSAKLYATLSIVAVQSNGRDRPQIPSWVLVTGPSPTRCFATGVISTFVSLAFVSGAVFTALAVIQPTGTGIGG